MQDNKEIITELNKLTSLELHETISLDEIQQALANYLNKLIIDDFEKLIQLLYRVDVSEPRLKQLLKDNPAEDAGALIANLVIERQSQKIKSRQAFKKNEASNDGDDRW